MKCSEDTEQHVQFKSSQPANSVKCIHSYIKQTECKAETLSSDPMQCTDTMLGTMQWCCSQKSNPVLKPNKVAPSCSTGRYRLPEVGQRCTTVKTQMLPT